MQRAPCGVKQVIGNHEFDYGPDVLGEYLDMLHFPVLSSNIDASKEFALSGKISPSTTVEVDGTCLLDTRSYLSSCFLRYYE